MIMLWVLGALGWIAFGLGIYLMKRQDDRDLKEVYNACRRLAAARKELATLKSTSCRLKP